MKMGAAAVYIRVSCVSSDSAEQKSDVKGSPFCFVSDSVSDQQIPTFSCFE